jgi:hypothetical protein
MFHACIFSLRATYEPPAVSAFNHVNTIRILKLLIQFSTLFLPSLFPPQDLVLTPYVCAFSRQYLDDCEMQRRDMKVTDAVFKMRANRLGLVEAVNRNCNHFHRWS